MCRRLELNPCLSPVQNQLKIEQGASLRPGFPEATEGSVRETFQVQARDGLNDQVERIYNGPVREPLGMPIRVILIILTDVGKESPLLCVAL